MTLKERKQIRDKKLGDYYDARDDRQALCGKVSDYINIFRDIVKSYDDGKLRVISSSLNGVRVPTQTEFEEAWTKCKEAHDHEQRLYREAIEAGVNPSRMPPQST